MTKAAISEAGISRSPAASELDSGVKIMFVHFFIARYRVGKNDIKAAQVEGYVHGGRGVLLRQE